MQSRNLVTKWQPTKQVSQSCNYLSQNSSFLADFEDIEDFILNAFSKDPKLASALEYHLVQIRSALVKFLWGKEIFLSISIIDKCLFDFIKEGSKNPIQDLLKLVLKKDAHKPGFILYPLHSFGVIGLGIWRFFHSSEIHFSIPSAEIVITPQTNSIEKSLQFLENVCQEFGIRKGVDKNLIFHFKKSRGLKWLTTNPLLAVKVRSQSGSYYENQSIYILKLRLNTALVMMLSTMGKKASGNQSYEFSSTSRINNQETLDLHHYLTFETPVKNKPYLKTNCIPINVSGVELAHLSDLPVEICPEAWKSKKGQSKLTDIQTCLKAIERGYLEHVVLSSNRNVPYRTYKKIVESIEWFRRSHSASIRENEAIVSLAVAIETLLTDNYAPGISNTILRRIKICLKGIPGTRSYQKAVQNLIECRGETLHYGSTEGMPDLLSARKAYILCLCYVTKLLSKLPKQSGTPIADLLNDP